jgi:hypothetical protein
MRCNLRDAAQGHRHIDMDMPHRGVLKTGISSFHSPQLRVRFNAQEVSSLVACDQPQAKTCTGVLVSNEVINGGSQ